MGLFHEFTNRSCMIRAPARSTRAAMKEYEISAHPPVHLATNLPCGRAGMQPHVSDRREGGGGGGGGGGALENGKPDEGVRDPELP
jgi:hypothetical protein